MAGMATLNFEARIKRENTWDTVATMKLTLGDAQYGQGAIDGMQAVLAGWQELDGAIDATAVVPRLDTLHVE